MNSLFLLNFKYKNEKVITINQKLIMSKNEIYFRKSGMKNVNK